MGNPQLDPSKAYLIRGDTLSKINKRSDALWNGDNIQRGPGILRRGSGDAGFSIAARRQGNNPSFAPLFLPPLNPAADVSNASNPMYTITYGTYGGVVPTISGTALVPTTASNVITLGASDQVVYMECDFTYDETIGTKVITDAEIKSATSAAYADLTSSVSAGSGTLYQQIFGVTITAPVGSGPYTVVAAPAVGGSQDFAVCLAVPAISGPWGV